MTLITLVTNEKRITLVKEKLHFLALEVIYELISVILDKDNTIALEKFEILGPRGHDI